MERQRCLSEDSFDETEHDTERNMRHEEKGNMFASLQRSSYTPTLELVTNV